MKYNYITIYNDFFTKQIPFSEFQSKLVCMLAFCFSIIRTEVCYRLGNRFGITPSMLAIRNRGKVGVCWPELYNLYASYKCLSTQGIGLIFWFERIIYARHR